MTTSKRNKHDGCVIFGSSKASHSENGTLGKKNEIVNDVVLGENLSTSQNSAVIGRRHFVVRYKMDTKGYYLKDTGEGSGTFVRVDRPLVC